MKILSLFTIQSSEKQFKLADCFHALNVLCRMSMSNSLELLGLRSDIPCSDLLERNFRSSAFLYILHATEGFFQGFLATLFSDKTCRKCRWKD